MKKDSYEVESPKMDETPGERLPLAKPGKGKDMEPLSPAKPGAKEEMEIIPPSKPKNQFQKYQKGGKVSSASKRADGIAQRGKTRGRII